MFQIAVLGPVSAGQIGVVRQCIQCRRASGPDAPPCTGFGVGCFAEHAGPARWNASKKSTKERKEGP